MDIKGLKEHIDGRLDRLEVKIDDHLGRISSAEEAIVWIKGHVKWTVTLAISAAGFFAAAFLNK